jgi:hypothetical protein
VVADLRRKVSKPANPPYIKKKFNCRCDLYATEKRVSFCIMRNSLERKYTRYELTLHDSIFFLSKKLGGKLHIDQQWPHINKGPSHFILSSFIFHHL